MIAAHISGDSADRKAFAAKFLADSGCAMAIYICPKNIMPQAKASGIKAYFVAFEDLTKTDPWLKVNSFIGPQTALIIENASRYPKITSEKVLYLQRLSMQLTNKCLIDIVPFTNEISYLYTPYSYLDRAILGFAHWYAFRENYAELTTEGTIMKSHDPRSLAKKLTGVTSFGSDTILRERHQIDVENTKAEAALYKKTRDDLFAAEVNPVKIVTQLADLVHAFNSRRARVAGLIKELTDAGKKVLVLTNLSSYAKKYISVLKKAGIETVAADSFQIASARTDLASFDAIIFAEHPITNSYFALDVEAQCKRSAVVYQVHSDNKVCNYLTTRYSAEIGAIQSLSDELHSLQA